MAFAKKGRPRPSLFVYAAPMLRPLAALLLTFVLAAHADEAPIAKRFIVVAANPLAAEAGAAVLKAGGSSADAAIAVQAMLGLVEPQSSGIGGGAFMLH